MSIPRAFSCKTIAERSLRCISGAILSVIFSYSSSEYNLKSYLYILFRLCPFSNNMWYNYLKHFPLAILPARPALWIAFALEIGQMMRLSKNTEESKYLILWNPQSMTKIYIRLCFLFKINEKIYVLYRNWFQG